MHRRMGRWLRTGAFLSAFLLPASGAGQAQTSWVETVSLEAGDGSERVEGPDDLVPDPLSEQMVGVDYEIAGEVAYPSSGAPSATARVNADYRSGLSGILRGMASVSVEFDFWVVETASPPVSVSRVPVIISAEGATSVQETRMSAAATAVFQVGLHPFPLILYMAEADTAKPSDSFSNTDRFQFFPGQPQPARLTVLANVDAGATLAVSTAVSDASVGHSIVVSDELIPETSETYADYFAVEFSPGYWALDSTPVQTTTWGRIKRQYRR